MSRWRRRVDLNHASIRDDLRHLGYTVWDCSRHGDGFPDLLLRVGELIVLLEVKSPGEKLTPHEEAFAALFPVYVVHDITEAVMVAESAAAPQPSTPERPPSSRTRSPG